MLITLVNFFQCEKYTILWLENYVIMDTKLIKLEDETLVEVEVKTNEPQQISARIADRVDASIDRIKPILIKTASPVINAWKELNKEVLVETVEVEIGLSFEGEGNIYIAKGKVGANITVKFILKNQA